MEKTGKRCHFVDAQKKTVINLESSSFGQSLLVAVTICLPIGLVNSTAQIHRVLYPTPFQDEKIQVVVYTGLAVKVKELRPQWLR